MGSDRKSKGEEGERETREKRTDCSENVIREAVASKP